MNRSKFLTISFVLVVSFLFIKIYQHNKIVKLMYEKQRIERKKEFFRKKKNNLLVELYKMKSPKLVREKAREHLGMKDLKISQIVTITELSC